MSTQTLRITASREIAGENLRMRRHTHTQTLGRTETCDDDGSRLRSWGMSNLQHYFMHINIDLRLLYDTITFCCDIKARFGTPNTNDTVAFRFICEDWHIFAEPDCIDFTTLRKSKIRSDGTPRNGIMGLDQSFLSL